MRSLALVLISTAIAACGGSTPPAESPSSAATPSAVGTPSGAEPQTFADQVAAGQSLYAANCAGCHGPSGEGAKAPAVVGLSKGALPLDPPATAKYRKGQFKTAADVATFVVQNMPPGKGGSLKESEYWSILAFDLHANGVDLPKKLDASNAGDVALHK